MKILVTGCAGFIGSHVAMALLERGHKVIGVDRLSSTYATAYLLENLSQFIEHKNFVFYCEDIKDFRIDTIFRWEKPDMVIHLAALAGVRSSVEDPQEYIRSNVEGTVNIFEACQKNGVERVVYASSSSVYGNNPTVPWTETSYTDPISPYGASKLACEQIAHVYHELYKIHVTGLRFFTVYGPGGRPDMFPYMATNYAFHKREIPKFGNGSSKRDYTYIDDIVDGILCAALDPIDGEHVVNLGNSEMTDLNTFLGIVQAATGMDLHIKEFPKQKGDVEQTCADISFAKETWGWEPKVPVQDGMTFFVRWYKAHRINNERT